MLSLGDTLHDKRYRIIHPIAEGQLTSLFVALDEETRELLAVKVIERKAGDHEEFIKAFRTEAKVLAEFRDDPHVTRIHYFGIEEKYLYIVMEYVPGKTIAEFIKANGPMDEKDALRIVRDVAEALQSVYEKGIIHSDIKPTNIILTPPGITKVLDFGMALDVSKITSSHFRGTPAYMSPEQVDPASFGTPNIRSDIYSLGATLYEMLSAKPPFSGTNLLQLAKDIVEKSPAPLRRYREDILPDTEEFVMRCLKKNPADRFQNPRELIEAIDQIRVEEDIGYARLKQAKRYFDEQDWEKALEWARRVPPSSAYHGEAQEWIAKAKKRLEEREIESKKRELKKAVLDGDRERVARLRKELLARVPADPEIAALLSEKEVHHPRLVSVTSGKEYPLAGHVMKIGRPSQEFPLPDINLMDEKNGMTVSRDHAQILREPDGTYILEVRSQRSNSTYVNAQLLRAREKRAIVDGDELEFGDVKLIFRTIDIEKKQNSATTP